MINAMSSPNYLLLKLCLKQALNLPELLFWRLVLMRKVVLRVDMVLDV